jgi:putative phage-type endonuclease
MRIVDLSQDSAEWLAWRQRGLGASDAAAIMGLNPYETADSVWDTLEGKPRYFTEAAKAHIARGKAREPYIRAVYSAMTGVDWVPACVEHEEAPFIRASLDGLSPDGAEILEIKAPAAHSFRRMQRHGIPEYYYPQVQQQLLVTGARQAHFVAWPPEGLTALPVVQRIAADRAFQIRLVQCLAGFWGAWLRQERPGWG